MAPTAAPSAWRPPRLAAFLTALAICPPSLAAAAPPPADGAERRPPAGAGHGACARDGGDPACGSGLALGLLQRESGRHHASGASAVGVDAVAAPAAAAPAAVAAPAAAVGGGDKRELVLQHIPYNFGHTTEKIAAYGSGDAAFSKFDAAMDVLDSGTADARQMWTMVRAGVRHGGEIWGHLNPDLDQVSEVTGCPLYFTPGKFWPKDVAQSYFGNKTIFGILRDPYERLVAFFRGNFSEYGGSYPKFLDTCDVNGAVKQMLADYLAGDIYAHNCTFIPQAEYFDEPFGITEAVDNRRFPDSLNEFFAEHGYTDFHTATEDVMHVNLCPEIWAGDLDCGTKALVKQVYARDFDLLCKYFGYCDRDENCCIEPTPQMCPSNLEEKRKTATYCAEAK